MHASVTMACLFFWLTLAAVLQHVHAGHRRPYISMSLYTADRKHYLADATSRLYHPATYYLAKVGQ
jgi:hypothetical protein